MKKKRGPKLKLISERILDKRSIKPIILVEQTYSQWQKIHILNYLEHQQIPLQHKGKFPQPTQQEAADKFQIPRRTISNWVKKKGGIEKVGINTKGHTLDPDVGYYSQCWWPELLAKFHGDLYEWGGPGRIVWRGGFVFRPVFGFASCILRGIQLVFYSVLGGSRAS